MLKRHTLTRPDDDLIKGWLSRREAFVRLVNDNAIILITNDNSMLDVDLTQLHLPKTC